MLDLKGFHVDVVKRLIKEANQEVLDQMVLQESKFLEYVDRKAIARIGGNPLLTNFAMEGNVSGHHKSNLPKVLALSLQNTANTQREKIQGKLIGKS